MMISEDIQVIRARSGLPTLEINGRPYHSPYDPEREALKFCEPLQIEQADVIFVFGWGLGYCGKAIRSRMKQQARIIVFEPLGPLFEFFRRQERTEAFADSRFEFVAGSRIRGFFEQWALDGCRETDQVLWIEWPPAAALHGNVLASLKESFTRRLRDKAANLLTHFQKGTTYFENALSNFSHQASADAGRLFGKLKNRPLVIVSAGPSLDLNVQYLRGAEDRCFILSVDTALRPLLAAGVTPHAVIAADPGELNARHVTGVVPQSVYMIAEQAVHPAALAAASRRFLFGLGLFPDPLFAEFGFGKSSLEVWGSVATAALDLACRMGANPVIFVGQDFAFSWGREYARHTIFHNNPFSPELGGPLEELDIWGNPVRTTENLIAYRDFFIRKIATQSQTWFVNATEGGILRESVENVSLQDALARFCKTRFDARAILEKSHQPQKPSLEALRHFLRVLESRNRDCMCLASFLELTAKEELLNDQSAGIDSKIQWGIERTRASLKGAIAGS
jgi:hypothetical protein